MSQPNENPQFASADDFFANPQPSANGFPPVLVPGVQVNGKPVYVRRMSAADIVDYWKEVKSQPDELGRAAVVCYAVCDVAGNRLLKKEQATAINGLQADQVNIIAIVFMDVNGLNGPKS